MIEELKALAEKLDYSDAQFYPTLLSKAELSWLRLTAKNSEAILAALSAVPVMKEALEKLLALGPDHDNWCAIGPLYNCTCDLHPARQSARQALAALEGK